MERGSRHKKPIVEIGDSGMRLGYMKMPHATDETFFLLCERGYGIVTLNFEKYAIRRGCLISVYSDYYFSIDMLHENTSMQIIRLNDSLFDEVSIRLSSDFWSFWMDNNVLYLSAIQMEQMRAWIFNARWILTCPEPHLRDFMIRNQLENLLTAIESCCMDYIQQQPHKNNSNAHRILQRFWRLVTENCMHSHEVRFYAEKLNISTHYLAKITQTAMGYSPKQCIDWQRVLEIKQVLQNTALPIKQIADNFGFESPSYLISYFRRHTGMTPGNYRKSHSSTPPYTH